MGTIYGINLFLAESSATRAVSHSLLEPTGNIKVAQEEAARAFGADHVFFVTNGTSTSDKIVEQALLRSRRHRARRSELPTNRIITEPCFPEHFRSTWKPIRCPVLHVRRGAAAHDQEGSARSES